MIEPQRGGAYVETAITVTQIPTHLRPKAVMEEGHWQVRFPVLYIGGNVVPTDWQSEDSLVARYTPPALQYGMAEVSMLGVEQSSVEQLGLFESMPLEANFTVTGQSGSPVYGSVGFVVTANGGTRMRDSMRLELVKELGGAVADVQFQYDFGGAPYTFTAQVDVSTLEPGSYCLHITDEFGQRAVMSPAIEVVAPE